MTEPAFIASTWDEGHRVGAFFPGMRAVEITISTSLAYFMNKSIWASWNSLDISFAYPPPPSPDSSIDTSKNEAPTDSAYSLTAALVSNNLTIAPKFLAVTAAERPATPPPIIRTLAGGNLPAAVI